MRGWPAARTTLRTWRERPLGVVAPWIGIAIGIALVLLALVWLVGANSPADPTRIDIRRLLTVHDAWRVDAWHLFRNNMLVLALHAMACLAGFIVHLALTDPVDGEHPRIAAWSRSLAIVAVAFVPIATVLSIATQAWVLGARASTLSAQLHLPVSSVLWTTTTHSLPELAAVFLPLAASMYLIARGRPDQLLAATVATVVVAIPVIAASAVSETRVWPGRLVDARAAHPFLEGAYLGEVEVDPSDHFTAHATLTAGTQVGTEPFADRSTALEQAARVRGAAAVVLEVRDGHVVHELLARRSPHHCDTLSGMAIPERPMSIDELAKLRRSPHVPFRDGLVAFVGGSKVLEPADLESPPVERTFQRRC